VNLKKIKLGIEEKWERKRELIRDSDSLREREWTQDKSVELLSAVKL